MSAAYSLCGSEARLVALMWVSSPWGGDNVTLSRLLYTVFISATAYQGAQYTSEPHNHVIIVMDLKM